MSEWNVKTTLENRTNCESQLERYNKRVGMLESKLEEMSTYIGEFLSALAKDAIANTPNATDHDQLSVEFKKLQREWGEVSAELTADVTLMREKNAWWEPMLQAMMKAYKERTDAAPDVQCKDTPVARPGMRRCRVCHEEKSDTDDTFFTKAQLAKAKACCRKCQKEGKW